MYYRGTTIFSGLSSKTQYVNMHSSIENISRVHGHLVQMFFECMIILHDKAGSSGPPLTFKPIEHFYVHIKMLFLHGNKSEFGAKTVNIKMSWAVIASNPFRFCAISDIQKRLYIDKTE